MLTQNKPCFAMVEISRHIDVPEDVIQHPAIQDLADISTDIVLLINVNIFNSVAPSRVELWDPQLIRYLPWLIGHLQF